jgi:hypothetical protein
MHTHQLLHRTAAVLAGAAGALIVWALALLPGGIQTPPDAQDMPWWQPVAAAVAAGVLGWVLLVILDHVSTRKSWLTVAVIVAVASLAGPLGVPGISLGDRLWLCAMHIVVACIYIPLMTRTAAASSVHRPQSVRA